MEFPDEVTQATLSELNIHSVVAEDLLFFSNLTRLDMSDNEVRCNGNRSVEASRLMS